VVVDAGRIAVVTETDWTSTASTQDAYMTFVTALDGTLAEKLRITSAGVVQTMNAVNFTQTDGAEKIDSDADGYLDYYAGTGHRFRISGGDTLDLISNKLSPTTHNGVSLGDSTHTFNSIYGTSVYARHHCADGTSPVSDGTYKIFDGSYLGVLDGTITIKDGVITSVSENGGLPLP
jgi:hypothetical protein